MDASRLKRTEAAARPARLLIVDDNEDNRYTLSLLLEIDGYTDISAAEDGIQALEMLQSERFDLVLLDVMMPRLDGYRVLEALKVQGRLGDPPVIMISALDELASTVRCIELGAVDYLSKPFEPVLLRARVSATLEQKALAGEVKATRDRMEAELAEARDLQQGLCPHEFPPPMPGRPFDVYGAMRPAREVGGDFYDAFYRADGSLFLVIGDVAGKGAPAALFMARTRDIIRIAAEHVPGRDGGGAMPHEIVALANAALAAGNPSLTFVTLFVGLAHANEGVLHYCNAGHADPYIVRSDGAFRVLTGTKGPPAGLRASYAYRGNIARLEEGENLILYTDGVTEALDVAGTLFGEARLEEILARNGGEDAYTVVMAVNDAVHAFAVDTDQADDITLLAARLP